MEHRSMQRIGGYDAPFLNDFIEDYECPVCKMAFCEPIQTQCGHRLCLTCSEEIKKCNKGVLICPLDKKVSKPDKTFPDKAFERAVQHLQVKCKNFMKNCRWTGDLRLIDNHLENCKYQEVSCPNELCTASVLRKELMEHMETDCIFRLANCQYCYLEILYLEMQDHYDICKYFPVDCVNQCSIKVPRKKMFSHISNDCAHTIVDCQYFNVGCNFKSLPWTSDFKMFFGTSNSFHILRGLHIVLRNKK
ncbi:TNF receptor-associated factor 5-like isoform X2 [Hydra vulgaris]|uniref:TNF receptor-associated factor 5-like isoform X2 n=1 Tax=Hydra vulgaris TaxID=6087 RepID=UPI0032EA2CB6